MAATLNDNYMTLHVDLHERSYPIYIGQHLLTEKLLHPHIGHQQVFIVTNDKVAPLYLNTLKACLKDYQCDVLILPDGEEYKTIASLEAIFDQLIIKKHRRNTTLIGLGGGVIGDITGFAAACYHRGVNFIQVPTSLLAQVDASVGGKTAVNHPLGKNLIGAFHQPAAVIVDVDVLKTLPEREFRSGLAEIIKAALIDDTQFFNWLETHITQLQLEDTLLAESIRRAIAIKAKIVAADEKEANIRAYLNLGHTFAHGIELALGYGTWLHGEAVALGLMLAAGVSVRLGLLTNNDLERIKNILTIAQLPIRLPSTLSADQLLKSMETDKKKESTGLKLVLLKGIGQAVIASQVDPGILTEIIDAHK